MSCPIFLEDLELGCIEREAPIRAIGIEFVKFVVRLVFLVVNLSSELVLALRSLADIFLLLIFCLELDRWGSGTGFSLIFDVKLGASFPGQSFFISVRLAAFLFVRILSKLAFVYCFVIFYDSIMIIIINFIKMGQKQSKSKKMIVDDNDRFVQQFHQKHMNDMPQQDDDHHQEPLQFNQKPELFSFKEAHLEKSEVKPYKLDRIPIHESIYKQPENEHTHPHIDPKSKKKKDKQNKDRKPRQIQIQTYNTKVDCFKNLFSSCCHVEGISPEFQECEYCNRRVYYHEQQSSDEQPYISPYRMKQREKQAITTFSDQLHNYSLTKKTWN